MKQKHTFSILFYTRSNRVKNNGEIPIYCRITVKGQRIGFSINRNIEPTLWCNVKGAAKGTTKEARLVNRMIETVRFKLKQCFTELKEDDKEITAKLIKNLYFGVDEDDRTILRIYQEHNEKVKALIGKEYSRETWQRYETSLMHTREFIKGKYNKEDLILRRIDHQFIADYEFYFKSHRNCSHNTTMKYLKNFKKIIRIAFVNQWMKHDPFANYKLTVKKIDRGFLTDEELDRLINKTIKNIRLEQIRDCFVFSCFTGLAHSDLKNLTEANLSIDSDGRKWIKTKRKKTNNQSNIPLLPLAEMIVEKYKDHEQCIIHNVLLPVVSNQKMNAYLKEIGDLCDIPHNLTCHLARHTFATTVTLNNDIPIESVSKMLGHSSISMTRIYARLLDKKVGRDMGKLYERYS